MITIKRFCVNMLQENCYVVSDESLEAVIIDCGAYFAEEREALTSYISAGRLKPVRLLCTHGHFDHCFGNDTIHQAYGIGPEVSARDEYLMDIRRQCREMMGTDYLSPVPPVSRFLEDHETVSFGSHRLKVLPTPGHTPGSVLFYCAEEAVVFTGDTLFYNSIGRTDFPGGSWESMHDSLTNVVAKLPGDTRVLSGHGPETTIANELASNPYLR